MARREGRPALDRRAARTLRLGHRAEARIVRLRQRHIIKVSRLMSGLPQRRVQPSQALAAIAQGHLDRGPHDLVGPLAQPRNSPARRHTRSCSSRTRTRHAPGHSARSRAQRTTPPRVIARKTGRTADRHPRPIAAAQIAPGATSARIGSVSASRPSKHAPARASRPRPRGPRERPAPASRPGASPRARRPAHAWPRKPRSDRPPRPGLRRSRPSAGPGATSRHRAIAPAAISPPSTAWASCKSSNDRGRSRPRRPHKPPRRPPGKAGPAAKWAHPRRGISPRIPDPRAGSPRSRHVHKCCAGRCGSGGQRSPPRAVPIATIMISNGQRRSGIRASCDRPRSSRRDWTAGPPIGQSSFLVAGLCEAGPLLQLASVRPARGQDTEKKGPASQRPAAVRRPYLPIYIHQ